MVGTKTSKKAVPSVIVKLEPDAPTENVPVEMNDTQLIFTRTLSSGSEIAGVLRSAQVLPVTGAGMVPAVMVPTRASGM